MFETTASCPYTAKWPQFEICGIQFLFVIFCFLGMNIGYSVFGVVSNLTYWLLIIALNFQTNNSVLCAHGNNLLESENHKVYK